MDRPVPVTLVGLDCLDGPLPGAHRSCRRDGAEYHISLLDVAVPQGSEVARVLAARRWPPPTGTRWLRTWAGRWGRWSWSS